MNLPDLHDWRPVSITRHSAEPVVNWCRMGHFRFTESFFDHTVEKAMSEPFNLLFRHQLPLDSLLEWQACSSGLVPSGFIFHMSRCGSTLVSQMLAALPEHIVLSEPPPVGAILSMIQRGASDDQRIAWLRAWMSAMGQTPRGEQRLFVKLDSWQTVDLPLLHRAFPDTPWIFLYRNPVEVMVSSIKTTGMQIVPGLTNIILPGVDPATLPFMPQPEYAARVLAVILSAALEHLGPLGGKAFDYAQLPGAVISDIAPHFGLSLTPEQIDAMNAVTPFHAKTRGFYFEPDSESKRQEADDIVRALCAEHLDSLYAQLRAL